MKITDQLMYIHQPLSVELKIQDKVSVFALSIFIGLITLGTIHLSFILIDKYLISQYKKREKGKQDRFNEITVRTATTVDKIFKKIKDESLLKENTGKIIQDHFIQNGYADKFPKRSELEVPHPDNHSNWVKFADLSFEQKIRLNNQFAHDHGKLHGISQLFAEFYIAPPGQGDAYLTEDPRKIHGNDHCVRVAIYSAAFAYLYAKYHPDCSLTLDEIKLIQLVAAGHDIGRQADGNDVFDSRSAEMTVDILKKIGIKDNEVLNMCKNAIEDKDAKPDSKKSWMAKCLQNADSADYARLILDSPDQSEQGFEESRKYLDIFSELSQLSVLKDGQSMNDFLFELDALRKEMNELCYYTSGKEARAVLSRTGENTYENILNLVTPSRFPLMNHMLQKANVCSHTQDLQSKQLNLEKQKFWLLMKESGGPGYLSTQEANEYKNKFAFDQDITTYIDMCMEKQEKYEKAVNNKKMEAFGSLLPSQKDAKREDLIQKTDVNSYDIEKLMSEKEEIRIAIFDLKIHEWNSEISKMNSKQLKKRAKLILRFCNSIEKKELKDSRYVSSAARMLQAAAELEIENKNFGIAYNLLKIAGDEISVEDFWQNLESQNYDTYHLFRGSGHVRHHKLRVAKVNIDNTEHIKFGIELTTAARLKINQFLELLEMNNPDVTIEKTPAVYYEQSAGKVISTQGATVGKDLKITFKSGVVIYIGADEQYKNEYNFARLYLPKGVESKEAQKALSMIGLPMALHTPIKQDTYTHALSVMMNVLYPGKIYATNPKRSALDVYNDLEESEKNIVDEYVLTSHLKAYGGHTVEWVFPKIAETAKSSGVKFLTTFINGGGITTVSKIVGSILRNGIWSSQERFQRGIIGLGYVPYLNFQTGSANQVFARTLTQSQIDANSSFRDFPLHGPVAIIINAQAFERAPYFTFSDRGGVRNADFTSKVWWSPSEPPLFNYSGQQTLSERPSLSEFLSGLNNSNSIGNETVFNTVMDPEYFERLVVTDKPSKLLLQNKLEQQGIFNINHKPLEIVASEKIM